MRKYSLVLFLLLFSACGGTNYSSTKTSLVEGNQTNIETDRNNDNNSSIITHDVNETIEVIENNLSEPIVNIETNLSSENNSSILINDTNETIEIIENNDTNETVKTSLTEGNQTNIEIDVNNDNNSSIITHDINKTIEVVENNLSEPIVNIETNLSSENNSSILISDTNETIEIIENNDSNIIDNDTNETVKTSLTEGNQTNIETDVNNDNNSSILINDTNETIEIMENNDSNIIDNDTNETVEMIENNTSEAIVTEETNQSSENNITINKSKVIEEPYFNEQWYLEENVTFYEENNIDANASIHFGNIYNYTGKGIKIAVIDDGLDITHPELNGTVVATYDISTRSTNVAHASMMGHHGTAITGIIGANDNGIGIKGIASESQIMFLKHKEGMSDSETIELFNKAQEFGAEIINCSWGTYDVSEAVKEVIQDLAINGRDGKGIIIVFATGNNAQDMGNDESAIPEVIAVGATDKDNLRAWYSNYGENLDVVAPGGFDIGITTLDAMGENGVGTLNDDYLLANDENSFIGTSASAPIVTGVIALMLEKDRNMTRIDVEKALESKSDKIGNLDYVDGFNKYYGYGKVNVGRLLE